MEKWTDRLTIDMIPEQYRQLAEITGTSRADAGGTVRRRQPFTSQRWTP